MRRRLNLRLPPPLDAYGGARHCCRAAAGQARAIASHSPGTQVRVEEREKSVRLHSSSRVPLRPPTSALLCACAGAAQLRATLLLSDHLALVSLACRDQNDELIVELIQREAERGTQRDQVGVATARGTLPGCQWKRAREGVEIFN